MKCRVCGGKFNTSPLISYKNMPKSAQHFPHKEDLKDEKGVDLDLYQCPFCKIVQLMGEPVSYWRNVIRAVGVSEEMTSIRKKQFTRFVKEHNLSGKKVIEIGCGNGDYLSIMDKTDAYAFGIENDPEMVEFAKKRGLNAMQGFIEDEDAFLLGAPYDGFFIMSFLEHIPNPTAFLRGIANNLTDDAYGIVEVPNFNMLLEKRICSELIQDHLLYFTIETLTRLLENTGFDVLSCKPIWHDYIISAEVKKHSMFDLSPLLDERERLQESVDKFFSDMQNQNRKVAVWSAGHQSLANLSLLNMADKVALVIDSAPFKQGKYTPATHLPIVSPDVLKEGEIGAVLIMAGSYSLEIKEFLIKNYPNIFSAILHDGGGGRILVNVLKGGEILSYEY